MLNNGCVGNEVEFVVEIFFSQRNETLSALEATGSAGLVASVKRDSYR